ncbi:protein of unknown function [Candidatus Promineifilum breve]|uniref:DUF1269 domain-containing protein n=1 Tax=Candidatus Promineifilum breve TaxID=1806508 RepID=A0A160T684_9CHLR|nr:DUF1269 domain-containing protein [Candidatus Promineifilum breve]CUS04280.2 protein of unknown function [Candidatus Promineifilum breve]
MSNMPHHVIVASFSAETGADEALKELKLLQGEKLLEIVDAAVLRRDTRDRIHVQEVHDVGGGKGAVAGGIFGAAVAVLAGPVGLVLGAAGGALLGGLAAKHVDMGLPNDQLKNLAETLEPGTSMLVAIIEHEWLGNMKDALHNSGARVLMAEALREDLTAKFGAGSTGYAAYVDGREVVAEPEGDEENRLELTHVSAEEGGVVVRTHVLTKDGLVNRQITVSEKGITTTDTPVAQKSRPEGAAVTLAQLEAEAAQLAQAVSDYPESRYKLRAHFYSLYGQGKRTSGYGNSELNFMRWEINRGVLNRLDDPTGAGSPWWREVNGWFLTTSELAVMVEYAGLGDEKLPRAVRYWIDYMRTPSPANWYRAHNRGIAEGYVRYEALAAEENEYEQFFMNEVLFRVIFASSMVMGKSFGALGRVMSNPILPAVDLLVSIPHFYPHRYPMTFMDKMHILHNGYSLREKAAQLLDERFVLPQLEELYQWTAEWLELPELAGYIIDGQPSYPKRETVA